jgi:hypothetical protein
MKTTMPQVVAASSSGKPLMMVGCGILHKEVDYLIRKNGWSRRRAAGTRNRGLLWLLPSTDGRHS